MGFGFDDLLDPVSDMYDQILQPLGVVKGDEEKARQSQAEALQALQAPELRDLSPEDYRKYLVKQGKTELGKAPLEGRNAQSLALKQLQDIAAQGGLTSSDRARLQDIRNQEAIAEKGQRESILQNAATRGVAGSGLELAQQLASQQGSATRASARDLGVADLAQQRALAAIEGSSQIGTTLRGQDYEKASAQDAINRFNTDYRNRAGLMTGQSREDTRRVNTLETPQQRYENERNRLLGITGAQIEKGRAADGRRTNFLDTAKDTAALFAGLPPPSTIKGGRF